jgi:hypothetical protein
VACPAGSWRPRPRQRSLAGPRLALPFAAGTPTSGDAVPAAVSTSPPCGMSRASIRLFGCGLASLPFPSSWPGQPLQCAKLPGRSIGKMDESPRWRAESSKWMTAHYDRKVYTPAGDTSATAAVGPMSYPPSYNSARCQRQPKNSAAADKPAGDGLSTDERDAARADTGNHRREPRSLSSWRHRDRPPGDHSCSAPRNSCGDPRAKAISRQHQGSVMSVSWCCVLGTARSGTGWPRVLGRVPWMSSGGAPGALRP